MKIQPIDPIQNAWDSELVIKNELTVYIPQYIKDVCNTIQNKVNHNEFSILVKSDWNEDGDLVLYKEYVIPKQTVTPTSVGYNEPLDPYISNGYNVVIHSHPFKSSSFSYADRDTINTNFECSILYSEGNFTAATIPVQIRPGVVLHIPPKIAIISSDEIDVDISNITFHTHVLPTLDMFNHYRDNW